MGTEIWCADNRRSLLTLLTLLTMKILLFGRGVISVLYGWALEKAGHAVEFYVRPGRAAQYGPQVRLEIVDARRSMFGRRVNETWAIRMREDLPPIMTTI